MNTLRPNIPKRTREEKAQLVKSTPPPVRGKKTDTSGEKEKNRERIYKGKKIRKNIMSSNKGVRGKRERKRKGNRNEGSYERERKNTVQLK